MKKRKKLILEGDELSLLSDTSHETVGELLFFPLSLHLVYIYLQKTLRAEDEDHLPTEEEENEGGKNREGGAGGERERVSEHLHSHFSGWVQPWY